MKLLKLIGLVISLLSFWTFLVFLCPPLHWLIFKLVQPSEFLATAHGLDWSIFKFWFGFDSLAQLTPVEIQHMYDVRTVAWSLGLLSLSLIWFLKNVSKQITLKAAGLIIFIALGSTLFFSQSFKLLHKIIFTNNNWLLDPNRHLLIKVYPENFFVLCWITILLFSLLSTLALIKKKI